MILSAHRLKGVSICRSVVLEEVEKAYALNEGVKDGQYHHGEEHPMEGADF